LAGSNVNIAPEHSEIEVSLFGPGYGESLLLHLGENTWIVVDSCIDPITGDPAPLAYLHQLHVDPTTSVRQVIATHWHDDHIRGLGRVMESCVSAEFVCSAALKQDEFLTLVAAYGHYSMMESSGLQEFNKILQVLKARAQHRPGRQPHPPTFATASRCIWQSHVKTSTQSYPCSIYALSPSDASLVLAHRHIATLLPQPKATKSRIPALTPNHAAVALWVNIGEAFILLGSDLEERGNPDTGWSVILGSRTYPIGKASIFKIPHHGSSTADHPQVWQDMLDAEPLAILTPFARGRVSLPTQQDIDRICMRTKRAYTTAIPRPKRKGGRPQGVEKLIRETVRFIREVYSSTGHIRLRTNLAEMPLAWRVELFGDACPLKQFSEQMR
jgi:beta-lactamase superfamily II metal-dependent hydrolase